MTDKAIIQNYNIGQNVLDTLTDEEIKGLLSIANAINEISPVKVDISEGTINVDGTTSSDN